MSLQVEPDEVLLVPFDPVLGHGAPTSPTSSTVRDESRAAARRPGRTGPSAGHAPVGCPSAHRPLEPEPPWAHAARHGRELADRSEPGSAGRAAPVPSASAPARADVRPGRPCRHRPASSQQLLPRTHSSRSSRRMIVEPPVQRRLRDRGQRRRRRAVLGHEQRQHHPIGPDEARTACARTPSASAPRSNSATVPGPGAATSDSASTEASSGSRSTEQLGVPAVAARHLAEQHRNARDRSVDAAHAPSISNTARSIQTQ